MTDSRGITCGYYYKTSVIRSFGSGNNRKYENKTKTINRYRNEPKQISYSLQLCTYVRISVGEKYTNYIVHIARNVFNRSFLS